MNSKYFSKPDLKYTLRLLAKNPGFTLLSILVLAGGLGVSILAFTFNYTMFYKPIPLENGDSIYHICAGPSASGCRPFKAFEFAEIRDQISTMDDIGIYRNGSSIITLNGTPIFIESTFTQWNMYSLSNSTALHGRTLLDYDFESRAENVIVLSYILWQQHFDGNPAIIDETLDVDGKATRIVGIMPEGYQFPWSSQAWLPIEPDYVNPAENASVPIETYARLKPGISVASANAEIANLMQGMRQRNPVIQDNVINTCQRRPYNCDTGHISTFPLGEFGGLGAALILLMSSLLTGFIFLLSTINVGTLLLSRTNERLRDTSIRVALGAPRARLMIQLMAESLIISVAGACLGVLLAGAVMEVLNVLFTSIDERLMSFWQVFHVDGSTLIGAISMVGLTVLLTSVYPSWRIINGDFNAVMRDGTRGARGTKPGKFSRALVITSITIITLLLFIVSSLGTFAFKARDVFNNMNTAGMLAVQPTLDDTRYSLQQSHDFYQNLSQRLTADSRIEDVYLITTLGTLELETEGQTGFSGYSSEFTTADVAIVAGEMTSAGLNLLEGRSLEGNESSSGVPVILVSRSLAENLSPSLSVVGQRMRIVSEQLHIDNSWREIVGVVSDVVTSAQLMTTNQNAAYVPLTQTTLRNTTVLVRPNEAYVDDLNPVATAFSKAVTALAPELNAVRVFDTREQLEGLGSAIRLGINLAGAMAVFSFLVAIAGIFGLTRNFILTSTQEIGTRRALGARDREICQAFLKRGGKQAMIGFLLACIVIIPVSWLSFVGLGWEVVGVTLMPVIAAMLFLYGTIVLAIYQPIRQILRLEPSEALRYE